MLKNYLVCGLVTIIVKVKWYDTYSRKVDMILDTTCQYFVLANCPNLQHKIISFCINVDTFHPLKQMGMQMIHNVMPFWHPITMENNLHRVRKGIVAYLVLLLQQSWRWPQHLVENIQCPVQTVLLLHESYHVLLPLTWLEKFQMSCDKYKIWCWILNCQNWLNVKIVYGYIGLELVLRLIPTSTATLLSDRGTHEKWRTLILQWTINMKLILSLILTKSHDNIVIKPHVSFL